MVVKDAEGQIVARCGYVEGDEPCPYRAVDALSDIRLCKLHMWHARCEVETQELAGNRIHWTTMKPEPMPSGCVAAPGCVARPLPATFLGSGA
jgi:hypothetical protein